MEKMAKKSIIITILCLIVLLQPLHPKVALAEVLAAKDIYRLVNPSVLTVEAYDQYGNGSATASAFVIDNEGHAVTNYHVVKDAVFMKAISSNGDTSNVLNIVYCNKERDLAIFKLEGGNFPPPVSLGNSDTIVNGDKVSAIGNPLGLGNTISEGIISGMQRFLFGQVFLQFTTPISPGSSGGVLINEKGQVIGITTATMLDGQNINFAIPINDLLKVLHKTEKSVTLKPYKKTSKTLKYHGEAFSFDYPSNWQSSWQDCLVLTNADNQLSSISFESIVVKDEEDFTLYWSNLHKNLKDMAISSDLEINISDESRKINGIDFAQITITDKRYFGYNVKYDYRLAYKDKMILVLCYTSSEALFAQDLTTFNEILASFSLKIPERIPALEKAPGTDPLPAPSRFAIL